MSRKTQFSIVCQLELLLISSPRLQRDQLNVSVCVFCMCVCVLYVQSTVSSLIRHGVTQLP